MRASSRPRLIGYPIWPTKPPRCLCPSSRTACRSSLLRSAPPFIEYAIQVSIPLDDPHVVPGLGEGNPFGEHLGILHPELRVPAIDPGDPCVVGRQDPG